MAERYPFYGHDRGEVVTQDKDGFHERPMTTAELSAREPARKIAADIYRHANYAGVCYVEIWRTIADAYQVLETTQEKLGEVRAAYEFLLPYVHIDIRTQALAIYDPEPTPLETHIGGLGSSDQPEGNAHD